MVYRVKKSQTWLYNWRITCHLISVDLVVAIPLLSHLQWWCRVPEQLISSFLWWASVMVQWSGPKFPVWIRNHFIISLYLNTHRYTNRTFWFASGRKCLPKWNRSLSFLQLIGKQTNHQTKESTVSQRQSQLFSPQNVFTVWVSTGKHVLHANSKSLESTALTADVVSCFDICGLIEWLCSQVKFLMKGNQIKGGGVPSLLLHSPASYSQDCSRGEWRND